LLYYYNVATIFVDYCMLFVAIYFFRIVDYWLLVTFFRIVCYWLLVIVTLLLVISLPYIMMFVILI